MLLPDAIKQEANDLQEHTKMTLMTPTKIFKYMCEVAEVKNVVFLLKHKQLDLTDVFNKENFIRIQDVRE